MKTHCVYKTEERTLIVDIKEIEPGKKGMVECMEYLISWLNKEIKILKADK